MPFDLTDDSSPSIPQNPLTGDSTVSSMPDAPSAALQGAPSPIASAPPTAQTPNDLGTSHNDVFRQVAKALMGHETSYSVDANGNTVATETPGTPGHFFRNVVTAALLGSAAGASGDPRQGFFGGLARGGAVGFDDVRKQDLLKRQQAEQDFQNSQRAQQMQLENNRDQREQNAFATQETLRKAQIAGANAETYRLNMLTQGADFEQHQKLADQGKQHFADFDAAGLSPIFKSVPESDMQDIIKNRPGASSYDWEATGVKLGTDQDGKPTYQYTYSAYDPKGKVPVSQGTIDQWKKDGMDKYYPELFNILKPGKEVDATHYIELKRLDSKMFGDNLLRQKADQDTAEGKARILATNAQAAHAFAEAAKAKQEGAVAALTLKQQQMLPKAISELTAADGDFSKLSAGSKLVLGESAKGLLDGEEKTYQAQLAAGQTDAAAETLKGMQMWRGLASQAFASSASSQAQPAIDPASIPKKATSYTFNGTTFANIPPEKIALFLQTHPGAKPASAPEDSSSLLDTVLSLGEGLRNN